MSIAFVVYLIVGLLLFMMPLAIMTFQPEIRNQTNLWRAFNLPYRWNLMAALQFIMMLTFELAGMSFFCMAIAIQPK